MSELQKEETLKMPVSSSRFSPYPLRSCRNNKRKESSSSSSSSSSELESVSEWEDVRCVICLEPPHNAVLLQCASFDKGCRAYMCDTSARHSNCFKQYRKTNTTSSRCKGKTPLHCPYCRGEVFGTTNSPTCARRFMNARPRRCSVEKCDFSGTYSQLKTHLKSDHPGYVAPKKLSRLEQHIWEQLERETEFIEMVSARQRWEAEQRLAHQHRSTNNPVIDLNFDAFMRHFLLGVSTENRPRGQVSRPAPHLTAFRGFILP